MTSNFLPELSATLRMDSKVPEVGIRLSGNDMDEDEQRGPNGSKVI